MWPAAFSASVQIALLPGFEKHNMQRREKHAKQAMIRWLVYQEKIMLQFQVSSKQWYPE